VVKQQGVFSTGSEMDNCISAFQNSLRILVEVNEGSPECFVTRETLPQLNGKKNLWDQVKNTPEYKSVFRKRLPGQRTSKPFYSDPM